MAPKGPSTKIDLVAVARHIIDYEPFGQQTFLARGVVPGAELPLPWTVAKPVPKPRPTPPKPDSPLPKVDYVIVTWTAAEVRALADVLTPGHQRDDWYPYTHNFETFLPAISKTAPSRKAGRLGSYFLTSILSKKVLCFKSELHLNQDGVRRPGQLPTLPVADLFRQLIQETRPTLIITAGTAGATFGKTKLGDVVLTRAARFRLNDEFKTAPFNNQTYACTWMPKIPVGFLAKAKPLLDAHKDKLSTDSLVTRTPWLWVEGHKTAGRFDLQPLAPILTTDFFEYGTTTNHLEQIGCGVEMGDAVLGMVVDALPQKPRWLVIRNASDPQIDGTLPKKEQVKEAVEAYQQYGYWTSVNSSIAAWAVIAAD
jgi:hypothetical protein